LSCHQQYPTNLKRSIRSHCTLNKAQEISPKAPLWFYQQNFGTPVISPTKFRHFPQFSKHFLVWVFFRRSRVRCFTVIDLEHSFQPFWEMWKLWFFTNFGTFSNFLKHWFISHFKSNFKLMIRIHFRTHFSMSFIIFSKKLWKLIALQPFEVTRCENLIFEIDKIWTFMNSTVRFFFRILVRLVCGSLRKTLMPWKVTLPNNEKDPRELSTM
jgi:hypothetical protein